MIAGAIAIAGAAVCLHLLEESQEPTEKSQVSKQMPDEEDKLTAYTQMFGISKKKVGEKWWGNGVRQQILTGQR